MVGASDIITITITNDEDGKQTSDPVVSLAAELLWHLSSVPERTFDLSSFLSLWSQCILLLGCCFKNKLIFELNLNLINVLKS